MNEVFPLDGFLDSVLAIANAIAANAPVAVRNSKAAIQRFQNRNIEDDVDFEAKAFAACFKTGDQKHAMQCFVEKRPHDEFTGE